ncbi:hypothetical protein T492DRAFT_898020 [Pavlovales sp. CCMP2436]|nr:hypothetical protein T492DRAFT_898020 [Pavlovales sp. CCMP2436]
MELMEMESRERLSALIADFCSGHVEARFAASAELSAALLTASPIVLLRATHRLRRGRAAPLLVAALLAATEREYLSDAAPRLVCALALTAVFAGAASRKVNVGRERREQAHADAAARLALREAGVAPALGMLLEAVDPLARLYAHAAAQYLAIDAGVALALAAGAPLRLLEHAAAEDDAGEAGSAGFGGDARGGLGGDVPGRLSSDEICARTAAFAAGALANVLAHATAACVRSGVAPPRVGTRAAAAASLRMGAATAAAQANATTRVQAAARGRSVRGQRRTASAQQAQEAQLQAQQHALEQVSGAGTHAQVAHADAEAQAAEGVEEKRATEV